MSIAGTHNPILDASNYLLTHIVRFRDVDKQEKLDIKELQALLSQEFDDFNERLRLQNVAPEDVSSARYALAAFIDEVILSSSWKGKAEWMGQTLQWRYFGEHQGGEGFFNRVAELRQYGVEKVDLLEVYYLCLQLGFQGMYRIHQREKLSQLKRELKECIQRYRQLENVQLSTASGDLLFCEKNKRKIPLWWIGTAVLGLLFITYIAFDIAISHSAGNSTIQLQQYETSIKTLTQEQHYAGERA